MDIILSTVKLQFAHEHLQDVVIVSRFVEENLHHLQTVLELLSRADLSLKLKKSCSLEDHIGYMGLAIQPGRFGITTRATDVIWALQNPTNFTEIRSFLCLCNICRRVVPDFTRIAVLENGNLENDQPFHFGRLNESEIDALETLQRYNA